MRANGPSAPPRTLRAAAPTNRPTRTWARTTGAAGKPDRRAALQRPAAALTRAAYSLTCRKAAAAANGAPAMATSESADTITNGALNDDAPPLAAEAAATPKISTGIVSGRASTASNNPPRRSETVSAAPIAPGSSSTPARRRAGSKGKPERRRVHAQHEPEQGTCDDQRKGARRP